MKIIYVYQTETLPRQVVAICEDGVVLCHASREVSCPGDAIGDYPAKFWSENYDKHCGVDQWKTEYVHDVSIHLGIQGAFDFGRKIDKYWKPRSEIRDVVIPADPAWDPIIENKTWRKELDAILQRMVDSPRSSRHRSLARTHLEDCIMRLGMDLKDLGTPNPYPNSYKPENKIVDPTADGLKL
jgi:hypothetical protein